PALPHFDRIELLSLCRIGDVVDFHEIGIAEAVDARGQWTETDVVTDIPCLLFVDQSLSACFVEGLPVAFFARLNNLLLQGVGIALFFGFVARMAVRVNDGLGRTFCFRLVESARRWRQAEESQRSATLALAAGYIFLVGGDPDRAPENVRG